MKSIFSKIALMLVICLIFENKLKGCVTVNALDNVSKVCEVGNPYRDISGNSVWDCLFFGSYLQEDTNGDGLVDINDKKLPIRWRVLESNGKEALLMADMGVDCVPYNVEEGHDTWENSTIRSWLNSYSSDKNISEIDYSKDGFLKNAFTAQEINLICDSKVENKANSTYKTSSGRDTVDKVFVLSLEESIKTEFGFSDSFDSSETRYARCTDYAKSKGAFASKAWAYENNSWWWLRTAGKYYRRAADVNYDGKVYDDGYYVEKTDGVVRPVIRVVLSEDLFRYAGIVRSNGTYDENEQPGKGGQTAVKPEPTPTVAPKAEEYVFVKGQKNVIDVRLAKIKGDKTYKVTYSMPGIVKVNAKGKIVPKKKGSTQVTVSGIKGIVTLNITVREPGVPKQIVMYLGDESKMDIQEAEGLDVSYLSLKANIITVDKTGTIKAIAAGKGKVVTYINGRKYKTTVKVVGYQN